MADVFKGSEWKDAQFGKAPPWGNQTGRIYTLETDSSGVLRGGNKTTALANGDVVVAGRLSAGTVIWPNVEGGITDAGTAGTTISCGFRYTDGVDDADVPQKDDYFIQPVSTAATSKLTPSSDVYYPVKLPKDAFVTFTVGGADHASAFRMDAIIRMRVDGRDEFK